jgi:hypothetical protein
MPHLDKTDGGWKSRKLLFSVFVVFLSFVGWILGGIWPVLQVNYISMLGALTGTLTLFIGGNLGAKHVVGNNIAKLAPVPEEVVDIPKPSVNP